MGDIVKEIAEGLYYRHGQYRAAYNSGTASINLRPIFRRFVVHDVLFVPRPIDEEIELSLSQKHGQIANIEISRGRILPRNTILAREVFDQNRNNEIESSRLMFIFPFFASHLSMPCKPGEHVWVMFEDIVSPAPIGYWLSRIVGFDHTDDVNHSHAPRDHDTDFNFLSVNPAKSPRYHFKNGSFIYRDENPDRESSLILSSPFLKVGSEQSSEAVYEDIIQTAEASSAVVREAVPRFRKKPGDLALEGSNNALIVLSNERTGSLIGSSSAGQPADFFTSAGTIDMVVGRGSTPDTSGKLVSNDLGFSELDKFGLNVAPSEGDLDYSADRSRILISQRTLPDKKFSIKDYNSARLSTEDSSEGDAAIVIRSDKVRIIARSDIQFLVQGFESGTDPLTGQTIKNSLSDSTKWSSITIKSNGDIIFTPSALGYIRLGGEDANRGILCTAVPVTPVAGGIEGQPIGNTAGGQMGGARGASASGNLPALDPATGTFSNKVLIK